MWAANIPAALEKHIERGKKEIKHISLGVDDTYSIVYADGTANGWVPSIILEHMACCSNLEFICLDCERPSFYCIIGGILSFLLLYIFKFDSVCYLIQIQMVQRINASQTVRRVSWTISSHRNIIREFSLTM